MTEKVKKALDILTSREYRRNRTDNDTDLTDLISTEPYEMRDTIVLEQILAGERPILLDGDIFGFNRYQKNFAYYTDPTGKRITHAPGNITPNYARVIFRGYDGLLEDIDAYSRKNPDRSAFYEAMRRSVVASLRIADDYRAEALRVGNVRLADALSQVPHKGARSFYEACVFFKFIVFTLRCSHALHLTLGRFDQYMLPFYEADIQRGVSRDELFETLELFFVSLNIDSDIYFGVQQGDNGQSMVLGGFSEDGRYLYNDLSELCMQASLELSLIDPKINLRVGKGAPDHIYEIGTKLTAKGLGFPQYCNDDLIIPYLISLGYDKQDAYNYAVAACWEPISQNNAYDVPNQTVINLPELVDGAIREALRDGAGFEALMGKVRRNIGNKADELTDRFSLEKHPENASTRLTYLSLFIDGCLERGLDFTAGGAKYNNYGVLSAGIANAADALAAVKKLVLEDGTIAPDTLLKALEANFEGYEDIRHLLLNAPKMGNNDDYVDAIAGEIMDIEADCFHNRKNGSYGGVWRVGTGSAQFYVMFARDLRATADGRRAGDAFGCSFSPAISTKTRGPLSMLQSFTKNDLSRMCNGGPITVELHDTVFRNSDGEKKVAQFVKAFVMLGGHQLQLNSINREMLLEVQKHPEEHKNLIVRVWGWSGYFCELGKEYQDHIISRTEYCM